MAPYIIVKYLHLLGIFTMIACLATELALVKEQMLRSEVKRLSKVDTLYGFAAIVSVAAGLLMWFGVGKGTAFYNNPVLHVKVGIVVIVGLVSISPTVYFMRQRKGNPIESVEVPARIRNTIAIQLVLLALVPLLAIMMANGRRF